MDTYNSPTMHHKELTAEEVTLSRTLHGSNRPNSLGCPSLWKLYLDKWNEPVIRILLLAAFLSLVIGILENEYIETVGIMLAVFLTTGIGFYFEYDAIRKLAALKALDKDSVATVRRDGNVMLVSQNELVVGDVVLLKQGDEVPADGYIVFSKQLTVDESKLTGEAAGQKSVRTEDTKSSTYAPNRLLRSTIILTGNAEMVVDAVGDQTERENPSNRKSVEKEMDTSMNQQLKHLVNVISKTSIAIAVLVFAISTWMGITRYLDFTSSHGVPWLDIVLIVLRNFMLAVALIVMAVPEGLPMTVTLNLALNMRRMLKTNTLVRRKHACETMGTITVICTDKTGTLTENKMEVCETLSFTNDDRNMTINMAINSTADFEEIDNEHIRPLGDPIETALLLHLGKNGENYKTIRNAYIVKERLPFSPERRFMASLVTGNDGNSILFVKGSPDVVMSLCKHNEENTAKANLALAKWQKKAMKTLAFAQLMVSNDSTQTIEEFLKGGPQLVGICGISDPIRREVPSAIGTCLKAGTSVKIVTGDTAGTAIEIAKRIGLWNRRLQHEEQIISGEEFAALSDEEAMQRIAHLKIMCGARPMDKLRLVQLLQKRGELVAVTGDCIGDVPTLKCAQVGLSKGNDTAAAKEASDITLIDGSFVSIVNAIAWGRSLYKNIQRFLGYQLSIGLTVLIITLAGSLLCDEMPLTVTQILWINLIMDAFASLALATIPPSMKVMRAKPRKPSDFIIDKALVCHIIASTTCFTAVMLALMFHFDSSLITGSKNLVSLSGLTIIFTTFVLLQFWNLLNAKAWGSGHSAFHKLKSCKGLLLVLGFIAVCQVLMVCLGGNILRVAPMDFLTWGILWGGTSLVLWGGELARLKL